MFDDNLHAAAASNGSVSLRWVVNSGASRHCYAEASDFDSLSVHNEMGNVSRIHCKIKGSGSVTLTTPDQKSRIVKIALKDVLHVQDLSSSSNGNYLRPLSVRLATLGGFRCSFAFDRDLLENDRVASIPVSRYRGLVWLPTMESQTALSASSLISIDLLHRRCGHLQQEGLLKHDKLRIDGLWVSLCPPHSNSARNVQSVSQRSATST